MTHVIRAQNVRQAYNEGMMYVRAHGVEETTRNGPAIVVPWPVVTVYERPDQRVLLDPARDANPFFHLLEAFWMLAGRNDVESLMRYNAGMKKYSDDGAVFHGAYGQRWRHHFGRDQLAEIVRLLRANPNDRRIVLQMWDPAADLGLEGLDFPCNNLCYFRQAAPGVLDMTIACRSNDALFGAYGANAVHFSVLHEFVAAMVGMAQGAMHQMSNNLHIYLDTADRVGEPLPYTGYSEPVTPLFGDLREAPITGVLKDIEDMWSDVHFLPRYLPRSTHALVDGMRWAWHVWKEKGSWDLFAENADMIPHEDWRTACVEWGHRRAEKFS